MFLGVFALAILQAVIRRARNPFSEVPFDTLPAELRDEVARVFPSLQVTKARITKLRDEARVHGLLAGEAVVVEGEFDPAGAMIEFELERHQGKRTRGSIDREALPEAAREEMDRVLGDALPHFSTRRLTTGTLGSTEHYEVKGTAGPWKWEIAVYAAGQLLEVEKERLRSAS